MDLVHVLLDPLYPFGMRPLANARTCSVFYCDLGVTGRGGVYFQPIDSLIADLHPPLESEKAADPVLALWVEVERDAVNTPAPIYVHRNKEFFALDILRLCDIAVPQYEVV